MIDKDNFSLLDLLSYTKDMGNTEVEGFYLINPKSNDFVLIENDEQLYNLVCHLNHLDHLDLFIKHVVNEPLLVDETVPCGFLYGLEVVKPSETTLNKKARETSIVPKDVQESAANNTFVAEENLADVGVVGENLQGAEETTNIDVGLAFDLSSSKCELDNLPDEDDSDVNEELTSLRHERRNKKKQKKQRKKPTLTEIILGEAGIDKGFEDIDRPSKEGRFAGKLVGDEDYYTSSDIESDDSTDDTDVLAKRGIDLPPRRRSKKGRPKRCRRKVKDEPRKKHGKLSKKGVKMTCSNCQQTCHNKSGCRNMVNSDICTSIFYILFFAIRIFFSFILSHVPRSATQQSQNMAPPPPRSSQKIPSQQSNPSSICENTSVVKRQSNNQSTGLGRGRGRGRVPRLGRGKGRGTALGI
ncbi:hypothetical protein A4A49_43099, partial [Nicotiana attenuata]